MNNSLVISLKSVDIFRSGKLILGSVDLAVNRGEWVYVIGRVGSGKSSLIKILNAELGTFTGEVMVAGYDLGKIKLSAIPLLRRKLGVIFQDFRLLADRNVYDNLSFVLRATGWRSKKAVEDRIVEVSDRVGLADKLMSMPHELSGGEQQRAAIARALLNDPEVVLADEPTGNLDPDTSDELVQLLKEINSQGKTILMATHDYPLLHRFPARTLICENSKICDPSAAAEEVDFADLLG